MILQFWRSLFGDGVAGEAVEADALFADSTTLVMFADSGSTTMLWQ